MNKSLVPRLLLLILAVIVVWSAVLCLKYNDRTRQVRQFQLWATQGALQQQAFSLLVNDCNEYAKHNRAMEQLLSSISTAPRATTPAAPTPASKPTGK